MLQLSQILTVHGCLLTHSGCGTTRIQPVLAQTPIRGNTFTPHLLPAASTPRSVLSLDQLYQIKTDT
jgi:hypothetical protein